MLLAGLGGRTTLMLSETSNLMAVSTLNRMVQQLDDVHEDLRTVQNLTNSLRVRAVDLNSGTLPSTKRAANLYIFNTTH